MKNQRIITILGIFALALILGIVFSTNSVAVKTVKTSSIESVISLDDTNSLAMLVGDDDKKDDTKKTKKTQKTKKKSDCDKGKTDPGCGTTKTHGGC